MKNLGELYHLTGMKDLPEYLAHVEAAKLDQKAHLVDLNFPSKFLTVFTCKTCGIRWTQEEIS